MAPTKVILTQNGEVKAVCATSNEAFAKLLSIQPFSTTYALRWGGWRYVEMYGDFDIEFTRDVMRSELGLGLDPGGEDVDADGDYVYITKGSRGNLFEETDSHLHRYITISVDDDTSLIYPLDSYKLIPQSNIE